MTDPQWQELGKSLGVIASFLGVVALVVKYLVSDWFAKTKELQELKLSQSARLIERLETQVKELEQKLNDHALRLERHEGKLAAADVKFDNLIKQMDDYSKATKVSVERLADLSHRRFLQVEQAVNQAQGSKKVAIGKDSYIIKGGNGDEGE